VELARGTERDAIPMCTFRRGPSALTADSAFSVPTATEVRSLRVDYRVILPTAAHALKKLDEVARSVPLEPRLLELMRLRASQINGCAQCVELHAKTARSLGEDEGRLALVSVWHDSASFTTRERAALGWCEALTTLPGGATERAYEELSTSFKDDEIVALTLAVIAINGWNRLRIGLDGPATAGRAADAQAEGEVPDPRARELAERLRRLGAEIAQTREDYRRATEGPPSPRYYESGTVHPELDDQSITP
jgi:AhpD family alkylhydroperoxidase